MMGKQVMFAAGVAVGYILGARAGRERYEAIIRSMRELKERPEIQETAAVVTAQAGHIAGSVANRARDVMSSGRPGAGSGSGEADAWAGDGSSPATEGSTDRTA